MPIALRKSANWLAAATAGAAMAVTLTASGVRAQPVCVNLATFAVGPLPCAAGSVARVEGPQGPPGVGPQGVANATKGANGPVGPMGPGGPSVTYFTGGTGSAKLAGANTSQALAPGNGVAPLNGAGPPNNAVPVPAGNANNLRVILSGGAALNDATGGFTFTLCQRNTCPAAAPTVSCSILSTNTTCVSPGAANVAYAANAGMWVRVTSTASAQANTVNARWSVRFEVPPGQK